MTDRRMRSIIAFFIIAAIALIGVGLYVALSGKGSENGAVDRVDDYWIASRDEVPPDLVLSSEHPTFPEMDELTFSGENDQIIPIEVMVPSLLTFTCAECKPGSHSVTAVTNGDDVVDILPHETNISIRSFNPANPLLGVKIVGQGEWTLTITDLNSVPRFDGELSGNGDAVYYYEGDASSAHLTATAGNMDTGMIYYASAGNREDERYINEAPNETTVDISPGIIHIKATGNWTLTPQD